MISYLPRIGDIMRRNTLIRTIKMELIIRKEIWRRMRERDSTEEEGLGGSADQMSFCWKTPGGYLFVSQQQG